MIEINCDQAWTRCSKKLVPCGRQPSSDTPAETHRLSPIAMAQFDSRLHALTTISENCACRTYRSSCTSLHPKSRQQHTDPATWYAKIFQSNSISMHHQISEDQIFPTTSAVPCPWSKNLQHQRSTREAVCIGPVVLTMIG